MVEPITALGLAFRCAIIRSELGLRLGPFPLEI